MPNPIGRPPSKEPTIQVGFRLPQRLHDLLKASAAEAGHNVSDEIRTRLERSFVIEAGKDFETQWFEYARQLS